MFKRGQKVRITKGSRYVDQCTGKSLDRARGVVVDEWLNANSNAEYQVKLSSKTAVWIRQGCLEIWEW